MGSKGHNVDIVLPFEGSEGKEKSRKMCGMIAGKLGEFA